MKICFSRQLLLLCAIIVLSLFSLNAMASSIIQQYCQNPAYHCIKAKRGQTWKSLFPDPVQRDIVMRINRTNTSLWAGKTIAIPNDLVNISVLDVSPMVKNISAPGQKVIIVNPTILAWGAYDNYGNLVQWGPLSSGKNWCPDVNRACRTVRGEFYIYQKGSAGCKSSKFPVGKGGAPMPYCMFFHGGFALHASKEVPGYNASHGCVRIYLEDAKWLNKDFVTLPDSPDGATKVIITDAMDEVAE